MSLMIIPPSQDDDALFNFEEVSFISYTWTQSCCHFEATSLRRMLKKHYPYILFRATVQNNQIFFISKEYNISVIIGKCVSISLLNEK